MSESAAPLHQDLSEFWKLFNDVLSDLTTQQIVELIQFFEQKASAFEKEFKYGRGLWLMKLGERYMEQKEYEEAVVVLEQSVASRQEEEDLHAECYTWRYLGAAYLGLNQFSKALQAFENSRTIAENMTLPGEEARALLGLGILYEHFGHYNQATRFIEKSVVILKNLGDREMELNALRQLGSIYTAQMRIQDAISSYDQVLAGYKERNNAQGQAHIHAHLGAMYSKKNQIDLAIENTERAREMFVTLNDHHSEGRALYNLGALHAYQQKWLKAEYYWRLALEKLPSKSHEYRSLEELFKQLGKRKQSGDKSLSASIIQQLSLFASQSQHPLTLTSRFMMENFEDNEIYNICAKYGGLQPHLGVISSEQLLQFLEYCQSRYLLLDMVHQLYDRRPNEFVAHFGPTVGPEVFRYGNLERVDVIPGGVLLENNAMRRATDLLEGDKAEEIDETAVLSCLMQLIDSIVLYERLYVVDLPLSDTLKPASDLFYILPLSLDIEEELLSYKASELSIARDLLVPVRLRVELGFGTLLDPVVDKEMRKESDDTFQSTDTQTGRRQEVLISPGDQDYSVLTAAKIGLPFRPAPFNSASTQKTISKITSSYYATFLDQTLQTIGAHASAEVEEMNQWLGEARYSIEVPLVFNYVLEQAAHTGGSILDVAFQIRETVEAKAFRKFCAEFDLAAKTGADEELYKLKAEIEKACSNLNGRFQQLTIPIDIAFPLGISLSVNALWQFIQYKRKRHLIFIDQLYRSARKSKGKYQSFFSAHLSG